MVPVPSPAGAASSGAGEGSVRVSRLLTIPADELHWRFSRSSGPGGQGVNTTDSRVELSWDPVNSAALRSPQIGDVVRDRALERLAGRLVGGAVVIAASRFRSQRRNRVDALGRLALIVREALEPPAPPRRPTRPSRASRLRRMEDKRQRGQVKRLRSGPPEA